MKLRHALTTLIAPAVLVAIGLSCGAATAQEVRAAEAEATAGGAADKIDPQVLQSLGQSGRAPVILLGKTQLLEGPEAFGEFCRTHADAKRRELRREVIGQLKSIAKTEQAKILQALGNPRDVQQFWLVNGIAGQFSKAEIEKAAALDDVLYIYPAGRVESTPPSGSVSEVLTAPENPQPFSAVGKRIPWNLEEIGADKVWNDLQVTGAGVTVVSFDSGVNYAHEDLRDHIWINSREVANNGQDDDGNGFVDDLYGYDFGAMSPEVRATGDLQHGTWTAGIIAGDGTGGLVTGVAPDAKVMIIRAGGGNAMAITAFQYMIENGGDVVNMSFSRPNLGNSRGLWRRMAEHAVCAGLVQVSGAGNFQQTEEIPVQMRVPEDIPCVIAAGGVNRNRQVPNFCSLGPVEWASVKFYEDFPMPQGLTKPDVSGFPGPSYPLLAAADTGYLDPNDSRRGNSFSGPHAAGTATLVLSANPDLPAWQVKELLEQTATDIAPRGKDTRTGAGLLNAFEAVKAAQAKASQR